MENLGIDPNFWSGKSVLVTGHTGFKGGWLCQLLTLMGANVSGFALEPQTKPSLFEILSLPKSIRSTIGNINELASLKKNIVSEKPEIIFHLAAQALVQPAYENPIDTFQTNVLGTINLLESARYATNLKAVLVVTSDKCYENKELNKAFVESDPLGGLDPYSSSKACTELVTQSYRHAFFKDSDTKIASVRAGNVIGGGDWSKDRLIPDLIRGFVRGENTSIRNPNATRPWQHVLEPLTGYMILAQKLYTRHPTDEAWNFGPDETDEKSVGWIVESMHKYWGGEWKAQTRDLGVTNAHEQHKEANSLRLNSNKAKSRLSWHPKYKINQAIEETASWYKAFYAGEDMRAFTKSQTERYLAL